MFPLQIRGVEPPPHPLGSKRRLVANPCRILLDLLDREALTSITVDSLPSWWLVHRRITTPFFNIYSNPNHPSRKHNPLSLNIQGARKRSTSFDGLIRYQREGPHVALAGLPCSTGPRPREVHPVFLAPTHLSLSA